MSFHEVYQYWEWEMDLLQSIQQLHVDWLTPILNFICNITMHGEMWIALAIVLTIIPKTRKAGFTMILAMAFGTLIADVTLKPLIQRPRPFQQYVDQQWILYEINDKGKKMVTFVDQAKIGFDFYLKKLPADWSFPSGHSVCGMAASVSLTTRSRKLGIPALIVACTIVFARMYLFVHFPTDVLAGVIIGILCATASYFVINLIYRKLGKEDSKAIEISK